VLSTVNYLLANKKIPPLNDVQIQDLLQYLFTTAEKTLRFQVAEAVYRDDHGHPRALDIFLACTLPSAGKAARRRAHKLFLYPSDWQLELMYERCGHNHDRRISAPVCCQGGGGPFSALSCACFGLRHSAVVFHAKGKTMKFARSQISRQLPVLRGHSVTKPSRT